jgi:uncharacterized membrane protein
MFADPMPATLALIAALGSALVAGVFFAFSAFVMRALARLPAAHGIAAMQSINVVVLNPWFLGVFLGTAAICVGAALAAVALWPQPRGAWLGTGSALYLAGSLGVTMACNVPRNNRLAALRPDDADAAGVWAAYLHAWTRWNHVRTAASLAAATAFCIALSNLQ